jgi:hypothetical protein
MVTRAIAIALLVGVVGAASPISEVLGMLPGGAAHTEVAFTHWAAIRTLVGPLELGPFLQRVGQSFSVTAAFAWERMATHAPTWGWDPRDLEWEATLLWGDMSPVHLIKFKAGFDFAGLAARFRERGFAEAAQGEAILFTHPFERADWLLATDLAILNAALLPERSLLFLSSSPQMLTPLLFTLAGRFPSLGEEEAARALAARLAGSLSGILVVGPRVCLPFALVAQENRFRQHTSPPVYEQLLELAEVSGKLHPYLGLGLGYWISGGVLQSQAIFTFPREEWAAADLPHRQRLAEEGWSWQAQAPYSQVAFTVVEGWAEGKDLVLELSPLAGDAGRLFRLYLTRDLLFALCP